MSIKEQIRTFIEENFVLFDDDAPLADEDSLLDTGRIDSTGVLELIEFLERTFELEITDEDLIPDNLDSIGRIARFVRRQHPLEAVR